MRVGDKLPCCELAKEYIRWEERDYASGPEEDGWAISFYSVGDSSKELIKFCPFCGYSVYDPEGQLEELES